MKEREKQDKLILILFKKVEFIMKPSTENLLHAIKMVIDADCEKRSDLPKETIKEILNLRSKLQYFQEIDCE